ncbi:MAG: type II toxin-antitoxin system VapC family toxin [Rhodospirillales bacterium]|nr:type II toxin-antitoxin system VapC family toxin [Rhodospirillales bacterium]
MILVDTSIWVDHLRHADATLVARLTDSRVLAHPFVIGELALGNLRNRDEVLRLLGELPGATTATDDETLAFIARHRLMGSGIGYIDAHLLTSVALTPSARLWTRDYRLDAVARKLSLAEQGK